MYENVWKNKWIGVLTICMSTDHALSFTVAETLMSTVLTSENIVVVDGAKKNINEKKNLENKNELLLTE